MQYVVKDLNELAELLRQRAQKVYDDADRQTSARQADPLRAAGSAWLSAASIVKDTLIENMPVAQEYAIEYENAQYVAAVQIWASIQRHSGDPRFEYDGGVCGNREFLR